MTTPAEPGTLLNISDIVSGPIAPRIVNAASPNMLHTRIADVVAEKGPPPWSARLLQDERNLVTLIANPPSYWQSPPLAQGLRRMVGDPVRATAVGVDLRHSHRGSTRRTDMGATRARCTTSGTWAMTCRCGCGRDAASGPLLLAVRAVRLYRRRATCLLVISRILLHQHEPAQRSPCHYSLCPSPACAWHGQPATDRARPVGRL